MGIVHRRGEPIPGKWVVEALAAMQPRYNGLGAGFAAYGIYPEHRDCYALHALFYSDEAMRRTEEILSSRLNLVHDEAIPTQGRLPKQPVALRRYFARVPEGIEGDPDDVILDVVMEVNGSVDDAFIVSCGKNMGVFKAVGYPDEVARFYRIEEYRAYMWLGHGRYPTNTPGWWGGAHPFSVLGWSVIHNGEISSYGTNRRFVEGWGYRCVLLTDSEVLAYLLDLLVRKHRLPLDVACAAMSPPFWSQIESMPDREKRLYKAIRLTYAEALVNGPFSIVVATTHGMTGLIGLTDRIKLRPLVAGGYGDYFCISSEECAIRAIFPKAEGVFALKARVPVIARVER